MKEKKMLLVGSHGPVNGLDRSNLCCQLKRCDDARCLKKESHLVPRGLNEKFVGSL